jgi:peptide/nickel transport system ATP-binding protein
MTTPILEARDLTRHYAVRRARGWLAPRATLKAVDGVSFALHRGRTLGIVGESGCGKTTTANLAIGMIAPSGGSVTFKGHPVDAAQGARWRAQRREMQMVFQDPLAALDRRITIGRQVAEPLDIHGVGAASTRRARALAALESVGLAAHHADRYPHELSGGQRQRAVIARAIVIEPDMLVLDEPVSALDVSIQAQVLNLLQDLQRARRLAYLFISHDLKVVRQISDEVAVMYLGRIVEQGEPERVLHAPKHPYTRALVEAIPSVVAGRARRAKAVLAGEPPDPVDVPSGCAFRTRCPWAQDLCARETPPLETSADGDRVACHAVAGRIPMAAHGAPLVALPG